MEKLKGKATRQRSPNYPAYSLRDCERFLDIFYSKFKTSEAHFDDAVKVMGHKTTSSTANRVISAMESFGLLEVRGFGQAKFVKASNLGQSILLAENEDERQELLQKSALSNESFLKVWEKWGPNLPTVTSVQKSLQLEMHYSGEGARRFAIVIVDTYDFVKFRDLVDSPEDEEDEINRHDREVNCPDGSSQKTETVKNRTTNLLLKGENRQVVITVPTDLSPSEFELLKKWLELQKTGLVVDSNEFNGNVNISSS